MVWEWAQIDSEVLKTITIQYVFSLLPSFFFGDQTWIVLSQNFHILRCLDYACDIYTQQNITSSFPQKKLHHQLPFYEHVTTENLGTLKYLHVHHAII